MSTQRNTSYEAESGARGDAESDGKDPVRVAAGHKAHETRLRHEQEGHSGDNDGREQRSPGQALHPRDPRKRPTGRQSGNSADNEEAEGMIDGQDGKDPVRVAAGHKAYETRLRHEQEGHSTDDDDREHRDQEERGGKGHQKAEAGRKSGGSRRGSTPGPEQGHGEEHEKDPVRVAAGHKAYETRLRHEQEGHSGDDDGREQRGNRQQVHPKDPRKGATGRQSGNSADDKEAEGMIDEGQDGKDPVRVAAGHKAYETRLRHEQEGHSTDDDDREHRDQEERDGKGHQKAEAGRKSGGSRRGSTPGPEQGHGEEHEKDPVRVAAGHKAYETRLRHEQEGHSGDDDGRGQRANGQGRDGKDPQKVEAGKKGAAARHDGNSADNEESDEKNDGSHHEKDPKRVAAGHKAYETRLQHEQENRGDDRGGKSDGAGRHGHKHSGDNDTSNAPDAKHRRLSQDK